MKTQVSASTIPYGDNKDTGKYAVLNGVKLYYEIYGSGDPLVLLHGNGGNIEGMKYLIEFLIFLIQLLQSIFLNLTKGKK